MTEDADRHARDGLRVVDPASPSNWVKLLTTVAVDVRGIARTPMLRATFTKTPLLSSNASPLALTALRMSSYARTRMVPSPMPEPLRATAVKFTETACQMKRHSIRGHDVDQVLIPGQCHSYLVWFGSQ